MWTLTETGDGLASGVRWVIQRPSQAHGASTGSAPELRLAPLDRRRRHHLDVLQLLFVLLHSTATQQRTGRAADQGKHNVRQGSGLKRFSVKYLERSTVASPKVVSGQLGYDARQTETQPVRRYPPEQAVS